MATDDEVLALKEDKICEIAAIVMAATASKDEQKSNNVTQCSLCSRPYNDPRSLPCVHSFCFRCIDDHCNKKQTDGTASCPLCTDVFSLPTTGTKGLPKNFFLEKLVQLEKLTRSDGVKWPCDPCLAYDEDDEEKIATAYCVDCQEKQCESCASVHRKQKVSRNHKQVKLGDKLNLADIVSTSTTQTCSKHPQEELKFYCTQCKTAICFACYIELGHNNHKCSNFTDMADVLRKQITEEASKIPAGVELSRKMLSSLEKQQMSFMSICDRVEKQVFDRFDEIVKAAERDKKKLLVELDATRQEYNKLHRKLELRIMSLEGLKKYSEELVNKGTEIDIARELSTIVDRIIALLIFDGFQGNIDAVGIAELEFSNSTLDTQEDSTIVGTIAKKSKLKLSHTISGAGGCVTGMTAINNQLLASFKDYGHITVFDTSTFASKQTFTPSGFSQFRGLASNIEFIITRQIDNTTLYKVTQSRSADCSRR